MAALNDPGSGYREIGESSGAFRRGVLTAVETRDESSAELRHLGKGVGLAALVDDLEDASLLDDDLVGFEVPAGVPDAGPGCLREELT
jgi:hypothetical protein